MFEKLMTTFSNRIAADTIFHRLWFRVAALRRQIALGRCIETLISKGAGPRAPAIANTLYELWGDPLDQVRESYLRSCIIEFGEANGSVLMSGASMTTLILAAIGMSREPRKFFCFEEDQHWCAVIKSWLNQYKIQNTYMINAATSLTSKSVRFSVETKQLPKDFGLILCEGSRASPKSVISTLQTFSKQLGSSFTILARNVKIEKDEPVLKKWASENNATYVVVDKLDGFIKIACKGAKKGKKKGVTAKAAVFSPGRQGSKSA